MANQSRTVEIQHKAHIWFARRVAEELAGELGFDRVAVNEIGLAVTELATNLVKHHAENGRIISSVVDKKDRKGIIIMAVDSGPGIPDVSLALEDGHSTCGTMGTGLGAVNRLMDEFEVESGTMEMARVHPCEVGTRITCRKWRPRQTTTTANSASLINFSVMSRPMAGEKCCGDAYFLKHYENVYFVALLDGLGHGEQACIAAQTAVGFIRDNYKKSMQFIFEGVHRVCKATRGVAMSAFRIDLDNKIFYYAGIGNIVTRVFHSPSRITPVNLNGTLGLILKKVRVFEYSWQGGTVVAYTDGISNKWKLNDFPELESKPPAATASFLLKRLGRNTDDATIIVGK